MTGEKIQLLGIDFADVDPAGAAALLAARDEGAPFGYVVTPNADHLVRLHRHPTMRRIYEGAALSLLDSRVIATAATLLGLPAPGVCTGSDLTELLLCQHLQPGERITIVGLHPAHLPALRANLGLAPPAHFYPPMGFWRDPAAFDAARRFVLEHPARFTLFALGSPGQEILAHAIARSRGATGTGLCIGASLEFLAGAAIRAPHWMRQAGLEWLHRLLREPRRLGRRYLLDDPLIFQLLLRERLGRSSSA